MTQTDIVNVALQKIGQRRIQSIDDTTDPNAIACNVAWNLALGEISRETPWNCLKARATLTQLAPAPDSPAANPDIPPGTTNWAPATAYAVNDYVLFGGTPAYLYQCLIANTSSASFPADLTKGWWFQTTIFSPNYLNQQGNAGSGFLWQYAYELPDDFMLLVMLNDAYAWANIGNTFGALYEIYQKVLYCNQPTADIKYNKFETDTTNYDSMFIEALTFNLASMVATMLRKDDAKLGSMMKQFYQQAVTRARMKNGNEINPQRYFVPSQSWFRGARYRSTNG